jgi:hypothetical protein
MSKTYNKNKPHRCRNVVDRVLEPRSGQTSELVLGKSNSACSSNVLHVRKNHLQFERRHNIAEILLKFALNINQSINRTFNNIWTKF